MKNSNFSEDRQLISRISDITELSEKYSTEYFMGFLDEHQCSVAMNFLKKSKTSFSFFGGFDDAQRKYLCVFDCAVSDEKIDFPIVNLEITYSKNYKLSHRDFLGSFLALGIKREKIGDILVDDGKTIAFVSEDICEYILSQITKIGKVGVKIQKCETFDTPKQREFKDISGTVASPRLDCVVGLLCATSRANATNLIKNGDVCVEFMQVQDTTKKVLEKQTVSIRRHGRFIIEEIGDLTKKGRCVVKSKKYL